MVVSDQWPTFLYPGFVYDPEDAWIGLSTVPFSFLQELFSYYVFGTVATLSN